MRKQSIGQRWQQYISLAMLVFSMGLSFGRHELLAEDQVSSISTSVIAVAIYDHSDGSAKGPKNLARFLTRENGFNCTRVSPLEIREGILKEFDVLIMPGGSGSKQSENLQSEGRDQVRKFVREGGGYVGICAGAYLASSHYSWSLGIINARVWNRSHWARGKGQVKLSLSEAGCQLLECKGPEVDVFYGQGPLLVPNDDADLPGYEVLAIYKTEIAEKGAPVGAMVDTHAIIRSLYGKGQVICFSPHPEEANGPNFLMLEGVRWAAAR